ncbi:DUF2062 domain-containing protein [Polyangium mundeleinium]|uniref:DUF2062 domain-containing protein n=1 Tax=Polyangium mundeleinium TaxID=2995306 RepID=A0ABT5EDT5_9BACT|nr:DUF2062 domain-containing protein [Polyangium mundeleinium]MDC0739982.1 DUF2062 domain-containing protein [Polyangium mundeleinium]
MATFSLWREELRRAFRDLQGEDLSPARLGAAVAIGLFIGSLPVFGFHLLLVLVVCLRLRLHAVLAYAAANVSNPFFAPFLITAEIQVGARLRTGAWLRLDHAVDAWGLRSGEPSYAPKPPIEASYRTVVDFAGYMLVGAPLVGLALAAAGFALTVTFVLAKRAIRPASGALPPYRLPENAPPWIVAAERVASRFASPESPSAADKSLFHYVRIKLSLDPIARLIADIEGPRDGALGDVLDIGTGRGQLPILLLDLGRATRAHGLDWDETKIEAARRAAATRPEGAGPAEATFAREDARRFEATPADTVLLIDLLHYFTIEEQDAILRCAADHVKPGGRLLVREADTERGFRSFATLLEEKIFTAVRFNRGERVRFRPAQSITALLEARGFHCDVLPAWGSTPFSNVLIVARRPALENAPAA